MRLLQKLNVEEGTLGGAKNWIVFPQAQYAYTEEHGKSATERKESSSDSEKAGEIWVLTSAISVSRCSACVSISGP